MHRTSSTLPHAFAVSPLKILAEELLGAARDHDSFRKKILGTNLFVGNTLFMRVLKEQLQRRPILLDAVGKEVVSERTLDGGRMVG